MGGEIGPGTPLVFNHVPRTAGTAVKAALIDALHPTHPFSGVDSCAFGTFTRFDTLSAAARRTVLMSPDDLPEFADAVFGHITPFTTRVRYTQSRSFTILREPRTRLVSHWLFSRAHTDLMLRGLSGWGDHVRKARNPLDQYLEDSSVAYTTDNLMARFLVYPNELIGPDRFIDPAADGRIIDAALASLDRFDFVGLNEESDLEVRLGTWLGTHLTIQRANESPAMPRHQRVDVEAACGKAVDLIEERTRIDTAIWDAVAGDRGLLATEDGETVRARTYAGSIERYRLQASTKVRVRTKASQRMVRGRSHVAAVLRGR